MFYHWHVFCLSFCLSISLFLFLSLSLSLSSPTPFPSLTHALNTRSKGDADAKGGKGGGKGGKGDGGEEKKKGRAVPQDYADVVGLGEDNELVLFQPLADVVDEEDVDGGELAISKRTLQQAPRIRLSTDLVDAHLYLFDSQAVFTALDNARTPDTGEALQNIKRDLLPALLRRAKRPDSQPVMAVIAERSRYCVRARSIAEWRRVDQDLCVGGKCMWEPEEARVKKTWLSGTAVVAKKAQVGADCVVGDQTTVGDKVVLKKTSVGAHCQIAPGCRIQNSLIMDHVIIDEGVNLSNVIVGPNVHICARAALKECLIASGYTVPEEHKAKAATLLKLSDDFMA